MKAVLLPQDTTWQKYAQDTMANQTLDRTLHVSSATSRESSSYFLLFVEQEDLTKKFQEKDSTNYLAA